MFFPETKGLLNLSTTGYCPRSSRLTRPGRTLEEMDDYFRNNHWIVPLAKIQNVSATTREKELAAGKYLFESGSEKCRSPFLSCCCWPPYRGETSERSL